MKRTPLAFLPLALVGLLTTPASAKPTITSANGTFSDGSTVVVGGSEFGSNALKFEWTGDLIESTASGQVPQKAGWTFSSSWADNVAATDQAHSGKKSVKNELDDSSKYAAPIRFDSGADIPEHTWIFVSWWVRRTHAGNGQWKMFRINWQSDIQDDYPQIVMFNWYNSNQHFIRPGPGTEGNATADWSPPFPSKDDRWYRMDYTVHTSALATSDGSYTTTLFDPDGGSKLQEKAVDSAMSYFSGSRRYRWFLWQNYIGNGETSQTTWTDDLFVQVGTRARVEIGDASKWSACTSREIQIPSAWSGSTITISVNQGAFGSSDTAYLYVVADDGSVNEDGFPITFGGGTPIQPPNAPSNLIVN